MTDAEDVDGLPVIAHVTVLKLRPEGRSGEIAQDVTAVPTVHPSKLAVIAVPTMYPGDGVVYAHVVPAAATANNMDTKNMVLF